MSDVKQSADGEIKIEIQIVVGGELNPSAEAWAAMDLIERREYLVSGQEISAAHAYEVLSEDDSFIARQHEELADRSFEDEMRWALAGGADRVEKFWPRFLERILGGATEEEAAQLHERLPLLIGHDGKARLIKYVYDGFQERIPQEIKHLADLRDVLTHLKQTIDESLTAEY